MITALISLFFLHLTFAPLGAMSLWRRYSYLADAISHASLLATTISSVYLLKIELVWPVFILLFACSFYLMQKTYEQHKLDSSPNLLLLSCFFLACALLIIGKGNECSHELEDILFGDFQHASSEYMPLIFALSVFTLLFFGFCYKKLLMMAIDPSCALQIANWRRVAQDLCFLINLTAAICIALQFLGALLTSSMLITPALTARFISKSPLGMIMFTFVIGLATSCVGLTLSHYYQISFSAITAFIGVILYFIIKIWKQS
ncbi:putative metal ABC transporter permease [Rickettsiales endosymbiont of Paramecium tredecaurelia]|uniref:metal ABC transporter permease n=1 Tax=Candidatus Sarmatiella mevalonica TaxID=2770581 RepID=UPI001921F8D4|nr:metal ABC transporter permease [Candidatus Sarmatiella mevalonica]MBL3284771.1 putative metal ABC transporter permease [Candidatus Sarmatiella mevalonica]